MKKTSIIGALIVFGLVFVMLWGRGNQRVDTPENLGAIGSMTVSERSFNFGTISMKDGLVRHRFKLTNSSDQDIFVKKIYTSCMCTNAYLESISGRKGPFGMEGMGYIPPANETISVGESGEVEVVFDPNAHGPAGVGVIDRIISLADTTGGVLEFEIKAVVTP